MVNRVGYNEAKSVAIELKSRHEGHITYEELPKVDLKDFCGTALNARDAAKAEVGDSTMYTCNLRSYTGDTQLPGDRITEITEIDKGDRSIVIIQDKDIVTSPEMSKASLTTPKSIYFEASPGGVYDPDLDAVCWTSLNDPENKLCVDVHGRIFVFNAKGEKIPENFTQIDDFDKLVHELDIQKFPGEKILTVFDILKKDRIAIDKKMRDADVLGAYLKGINEAVSPSTRLKKYSKSKWSTIKIQPIGPVEKPLSIYTGEATKIHEHLLEERMKEYKEKPVSETQPMFAERYSPYFEEERPAPGEVKRGEVKYIEAAEIEPIREHKRMPEETEKPPESPNLFYPELGEYTPEQMKQAEEYEKIRKKTALPPWLALGGMAETYTKQQLKDIRIKQLMDQGYTEKEAREIAEKEGGQ